MERVDWQTFETQAKTFFEGFLQIRLLSRMPVKLQSCKSHEFDLVSEDNTVMIECKSYTWRPGGKYPNGKDAELKNTIAYLRESPAKRRIIAFNDDLHGRKSLVEAFVKRNRPRLDGIEVWRSTNGNFALFANFPADSNISEEDSGLVERAMIHLKQIARRNESSASVSIAASALFLGIPSQKLIRLGPQICEGLRQNGVQATFDNRNFSIRKDSI